MKTTAAALVLFLFVPLSSTEANEEMALERLMNIVSALQELGDEMLGEPVTGTLALGDTTSLHMNFNSEYMYHVHIWSDSYFNKIELWIRDFRGEIHTIADGDNASLAVYPDTSGEWTLQILLHEGASSDSASYAAAVFRAWRYL